GIGVSAVVSFCRSFFLCLTCYTLSPEARTDFSRQSHARTDKPERQCVRFRAAVKPIRPIRYAQKNSTVSSGCTSHTQMAVIPEATRTDRWSCLVLTLLARGTDSPMPQGALRRLLAHALHFPHPPPLYLLYSILRI